MKNFLFYFFSFVLGFLLIQPTNLQAQVTGLKSASSSASVSYLTPNGNYTIIVEFDKEIDKATAENIVNYSINEGVEIVKAVLGFDNKSVIITTSSMGDKTYRLSISNLIDKDQNAIDANVYEFDHVSLTNCTALFHLNEIVEGDSVANKSTLSGNGKVYSGISLVSGVLGNALKFDGINENKVDLGIIPGGNEMTVSLWVNMDYLPSAMSLSWGSIFDAQTDHFAIYQNKGTSSIRLKCTNPTTYVEIPEANVKAGEWAYIVATYKENVSSMYLNGALVASETYSREGAVPEQHIYLGVANATYAGANFFGVIDEVGVYDRAFTAQEVSDKYFGTKQVPNVVTGIKDKQVANDVQIYPNPVKSLARVDLVNLYDSVSVKVYDVKGTALNRQNFRNIDRFDLDFSNYNAGFYYINILLDNSLVVSKKMVVR